MAESGDQDCCFCAKPMHTICSIMCSSDEERHTASHVCTPCMMMKEMEVMETSGILGAMRVESAPVI